MDLKDWLVTGGLPTFCCLKDMKNMQSPGLCAPPVPIHQKLLCSVHTERAHNPEKGHNRERKKIITLGPTDSFLKTEQLSPFFL